MAHEYVHNPTIGLYAECRIELKDVGNYLREFYKQKMIRGHETTIISIESDIEDNLIFTDFIKVTKGRFPFIYSFVEPLENGTLDIDKFMKERDYVRMFND